MNSTSLPPPPFKDRKVGLVIFGAATVFFGCGCALLVPLVIFSTAIAAKSAHPPPSFNMLPVVSLYGGAAVALVWLGIGSIMARRWARALLAILSWSWLITGVISIVVCVLMAPQIMASIMASQPAGQPEIPDSARFMIMLVPAIMLGFIFIVLPLLWALFYGGRNVKATCEARDPVVRWTDRCPLPVLAVSLWLAFGTFAMLLMPAFHSMTPFFGLLLTGTLGTVFYVLMAAVWAYSAWALYRLDRRGWWVIFIAMILVSVSTVITYSRHDVGEVYSAMGYTAEQLAAVQALGMGSKMMIWMSLAGLVPLLGYLVCIRKFFTGSEGSGARGEGV